MYVFSILINQAARTKRIDSRITSTLSTLATGITRLVLEYFFYQRTLRLGAYCYQIQYHRKMLSKCYQIRIFAKLKGCSLMATTLHFGGEREIRTLGTVLAFTRFPVLVFEKLLLISFYKFSLEPLQIKGFKEICYYRLISVYIVLYRPG